MPQPLKDFIESGKKEFENKFPAMGVAGDPKDNCIYRFDQYKKDKSQLLEWHNYRTTQAYELGQKEMLKEIIMEYQSNELEGKGYDFYFSIRTKLDTLKQKLSTNIK